MSFARNGSGEAHLLRKILVNVHRRETGNLQGLVAWSEQDLAKGFISSKYYCQRGRPRRRTSVAASASVLPVSRTMPSILPCLSLCPSRVYGPVTPHTLMSDGGREATTLSVGLSLRAVLKN